MNGFVERGGGAFTTFMAIPSTLPCTRGRHPRPGGWHPDGTGLERRLGVRARCRGWQRLCPTSTSSGGVFPAVRPALAHDLAWRSLALTPCWLQSPILIVPKVFGPQLPGFLVVRKSWVALRETGWKRRVAKALRKRDPREGWIVTHRRASSRRAEDDKIPFATSAVPPARRNEGARRSTSYVNAFLTAMTDVIIRNGGTIDKYMGDAIMAFWNAPLDDPRHAANASETALQMLEALKAFNAANAGRYPETAIGIGINTGVCCVGNLGSEQRFDYSVIGDDVNVGARLETSTKASRPVAGARGAAGRARRRRPGLRLTRPWPSGRVPGTRPAPSPCSSSSAARPSPPRPGPRALAPLAASCRPARPARLAAAAPCALVLPSLGRCEPQTAGTMVRAFTRAPFGAARAAAAPDTAARRNAARRRAAPGSCGARFILPRGFPDRRRAVAPALPAADRASRCLWPLSQPRAPVVRLRPARAGPWRRCADRPAAGCTAAGALAGGPGFAPGLPASAIRCSPVPLPPAGPRTPLPSGTASLRPGRLLCALVAAIRSALGAIARAGWRCKWPIDRPAPRQAAIVQPVSPLFATGPRDKAVGSTPSRCARSDARSGAVDGEASCPGGRCRDARVLTDVRRLGDARSASSRRRPASASSPAGHRVMFVRQGNDEEPNSPDVSCSHQTNFGAGGGCAVRG